MERSTNFSKLLDLSNLSISKPLLGRKRIADNCIQSYAEVITNYASFKYEKKKGYFMRKSIEKKYEDSEQNFRPQT